MAFCGLALLLVTVLGVRWHNDHERERQVLSTIERPPQHGQYQYRHSLLLEATTPGVKSRPAGCANHQLLAFNG
eukprot:12922274-Prorocentrum_lima.AAC.1